MRLSSDNKFATIAVWLPLAFALSSPALSAAEKRLPNILFVFVDDQGYYDLGCYGATEAKTPRIDAMKAKRAGLEGRSRGESAASGGWRILG